MTLYKNIIIHPYDSVTKNSLLDWLIEQFMSQRWKSFQAAVAFLNTSGNFDALLTAMEQYAGNGNKITLIFGSDTFKETAGSDFAALELLLNALASHGKNVQVYLYHEVGRTFHPKIYLFSNLETQQAIVSVGSSNWSRGGLFNNIEANLIAELKLDEKLDGNLFAKIQSVFDTFWKPTDNIEQDGQGFVQAVSLSNIEQFKPLLTSTGDISPTNALEEETEDNDVLSTLIPTPLSEERKEIESQFKGKRIKVSTKHRQRRIPQKPDIPKISVPDTEIDLVPDSSQSKALVWVKPKMSASDVQRQRGNPTGGIRLTQAGFEVDGQRIDQTNYFRDSVFDNCEWTVGTHAPKAREVAIITSTIKILGQNYGSHDLKVSHKPSGEAGQGNYTTLLHWWGLSALIYDLNLTGRRFELYKIKQNDDIGFQIEIS